MVTAVGVSGVYSPQFSGYAARIASSLPPTGRTDRVSREAMYMRGLFSASPLSGREVLYMDGLGDHLSEGALHQWRARLQLLNLRNICEQQIFPGVRSLTPQERDLLDTMIRDISAADAESIARGDHFGIRGRPALEHDVKASENHVRDWLAETSMNDLVEFAYFPFTSEDVNNCAYNLMLDGAVNKILLPAILDVTNLLARLARENADAPVLGLTHGQPATTTTMGKRFGEVLSRMTGILDELSRIKLDAKCSGPVGNHNAITVVYPEVDYPGVARDFVESLGFEYQPMANQRGNHVNIVAFLDCIARLNTVLDDLNDNVWHNISRGWLVQTPIDGQVGSSVMPQKVNPWRNEVANGYSEMANAMIGAAKAAFMKSLFERDLTDHPGERCYGTMLGYTLVSWRYTAEGLRQITVNREQARDDANRHPEILGEVIQIAGRALGTDNCYNKMKALLRGRNDVTLDEIHEIIRDTLPPSPMKDRLLALTPATYIGRAAELTQETVRQYENLLPRLALQGLLHRVPSVKAVVWDFDHTLVDTKNAFQTILDTACESVPGATYSPEQLVAALKTNAAFEDLFSQIFSDRVMADQMLTAYRAIAKDYKYESCPHGQDAVKFFARRGLEQVVVTNRVAMAALRAEQAGYRRDTFLDIVAPATKKPSPDAYKETWSLLQERGIRPENTISIGDHLDDCKAAKGAGVQAFYGVLSGHSTEEDFMAAGLPKDRIFTDLGALFKAVKHMKLSD